MSGTNVGLAFSTSREKPSGHGTAKAMTGNIILVPDICQYALVLPVRRHVVVFSGLERSVGVAVIQIRQSETCFELFEAHLWLLHRLGRAHRQFTGVKEDSKWST